MNYVSVKFVICIDKHKDLKRNIGVRDDVYSRARLVNER